MSYDLNGMLVVIDKAIDPERISRAVALASETVDLAGQVLAEKASLETPSTKPEMQCSTRNAQSVFGWR